MKGNGSVRVLAAAAVGLTSLVGISLGASGAGALPRGAGSAHAAKPKPDGWPQPGFNGGQTSYNPAERTLRAATVKQLAKKWTITPPSGADSGPGGIAVQGRTVYVAQAGAVITYNPTNGKHGRRYKLGNFAVVPGGPILDGKQMIVVVNHDLAAVKLSNDKRAWTFKAHDHGAVTQTFNPIVLAGSTIFTVIDTNTSTTETDTYQIAAISAKTGKLLWSKPAQLAGPVAAGAGNVYVEGDGQQEGPTSFDHTVVALNAKTGVQAWSYQLPGQIENVSDLAVSGKTVFAGSGGGQGGPDVVALSAATGAQLWTHTDSPSPTSPANPSGMGLIATGKALVYRSAQEREVAVRASTGGLIWRHPAGDGAVGGGGVIYVLANNERVFGFRLTDGKQLWKSALLGITPVIVADGRMIGAGGGFYAGYGRR